MSIKIKNEFNQAIRDLKDINDQLFYTELKTTMSDHITTLEKEYDKVSQKAHEMHVQMERFEYNFANLTQDVLTQFRVTLQNIRDQFPEIFAQHTETLSNAYELFTNIAEEQGVMLNKKDKEWKELVEHVKHQQSHILQSLVKKLEGEVCRHLTELNDGITKQYEQLFKEVSKQLNELQDHVQKQGEQFEGALQTLKTKQQKFQSGAEASLKDFTIELQQLQRNLVKLEQSMQDSSEQYSIQIVKDHQLRSEKWENQNSRLIALEKQQQLHLETVKKSFIGLTVSQVIITASIVGLYFFQ
jgi:phage host-nuclease inhibitor protein Gam